jgi:hypothetical protein
MEELIKLCEEKSLEYDQTYFIFDYSTTNTILLKQTHDIAEKRDLKIKSISEENPKFYIGDIGEFDMLPSRHSYYDTETKISDVYKRYDYVIKFIRDLGFSPSEWNLGREYEQNFHMCIDNDMVSKFNLRIHPNLFIEISYITMDPKFPDLFTNVFKSFFNKKAILESMSSCNKHALIRYIRDYKIEQLMN